MVSNFATVSHAMRLGYEHLYLYKIHTYILSIIFNHILRMYNPEFLTY